MNLAVVEFEVEWFGFGGAASTEVNAADRIECARSVTSEEDAEELERGEDGGLAGAVGPDQEVDPGAWAPLERLEGAEVPRDELELRLHGGSGR